MRRSFAPFASLLAFAPIVAVAQAAPTAPAPAAAAAPKVIEADPALWMVRDKDTTIYLFGTIHALKPNLSWFDQAVRKAFDSSGQLVLEIPLPENPDEVKSIVLPLALQPTGPTLTERLPEAKRAAFGAALTKLGLTPTSLDRLQPWYAAVVMAQLSLVKAGFDAESGVDRKLNATAKAVGKPVIGLETMAQQLGYFHDLPEKAQIDFLLESVDDIDRFGPEINRMLDTWSHGQPDQLALVMNDDIDKLPDLYKVLLLDRNRRWADWIKARMGQPGTVFIAVGAGHLAGKDSVQVQLRRLHLKAVRVTY